MRRRRDAEETRRRRLYNESWLVLLLSCSNGAAEEDAWVGRWVCIELRFDAAEADGLDGRELRTRFRSAALWARREWSSG